MARPSYNHTPYPLDTMSTKTHWTDGEIEALTAFDFNDLEPARVPVRYKGRQLVMVEATADAAAKYRNAQMKATKLQDGKPVGIDGFADADPILLSACLFEVKAGDPLSPTAELGPVGTGFVRGMPHRIAKPLLMKLKHISGLNDDESEESLERQRKDVEGRLAKLREAKAAGAEAPGPKAPGSETTATSE